jgi:hypothetical protein
LQTTTHIESTKADTIIGEGTEEDFDRLFSLQITDTAMLLSDG